MQNITLSLLALSCLSSFAGEQLSSPNGKIALSFELKKVNQKEKVPVYSVQYKGNEIISESSLGFDLGGSKSLTDEFKQTSVKRDSNNSTWKPAYGERSIVKDHYNEMTVSLKHQTHDAVITFRCYDEGVAFAYEILGQGNITIEKELTEFAFPKNYAGWATTNAQGNYRKVNISETKNGTERPYVIEADDCYVAVGEAALVDYARMKLGALKSKKNTIISQLQGSVKAALPLKTPWRVIMVADTAGQLLENNDILLNLNAPSVIADTSWLKPGKVMREVTLTTQGGKALVDFAVEHKIEYVHFDAGWYGNEYDDKSDATTITVDPKRSPGPLDLHEVIRYAKEKDKGVIVYVNRRALETQLDEILPLYKKWGIKGLKYGFVNVGDQEWTTWLHEAVRKAAKYEMLINVHDEYRPTGYSRTYPNLMTQEGIRGDECSQSTETTLTILFTRMICGAGDNTICYFDKRVDRLWSHAYQLAKAVCIYSPLQYVYWYDRPFASPQNTGGAGGDHPVGKNVPELEFFDNVPTVWDDTRVLHGEIGKFAAIARRSGKDWFIGCMNNREKRSLDLDLSFLDKGKTYTAKLYKDDPTVHTVTKVAIETITVTSDSVIKANLRSNGGMAVHIFATK